MKPPDKFFEDYAKLRAHLDWARSSMAGGNVDIPQARMVAEEFREFIKRWQGRVKDPEIAEALKPLAAWSENMTEHLERVFLEQLQVVLKARRDWFVSELFIKGTISFAGTMKEVPSQMRPELEKIYRESMGEDYDAATDYRQTETDAEASEAAFRKALAKFETEWPERMDAAMRQRLAQINLDGLTAWDKELADALAACSSGAASVSES